MDELLATIVRIHPGDHILHTFLSYSLSFPSLSLVTILIMLTNDGPVLIHLPLEFKTTSDIGCSNYYPHGQHQCLQLFIPVL